MKLDNSIMAPVDSIEHKFAIIFGEQIGKRGEIYDADVFRAGNMKSIAKVVKKFVDITKRRISKIKFNKEDEQNGGIKARLDVTIKSLEDLADKISKLKDEPEDYHWILVADLAFIIDTILKVHKL